MGKEKKSIQVAIAEADAKFSNFIRARLSLEDYHEAIELSNVIIDLNIYAIGLVVDQNREAFGVEVDQDIMPVIEQKIGEGEEHD